MNYQNTDTLEVLSYNIIKKNNPSISLPKDGTEILIRIWKVITTTPRPTYNKYIEGLREIAPVAFQQTWEVYSLTTEEVDANIANAKESKYLAIWNYGNTLISNVENTYSATSRNTKQGRKLSNDAQKRTKKIQGGDTLTAEEQTDEDWYDAYTDWEDNINDDADSHCDVVENMTDAQAIYDIDVASLVWTSWTPPV